MEIFVFSHGGVNVYWRASGSWGPGSGQCCGSGMIFFESASWSGSDFSDNFGFDPRSDPVWIYCNNLSSLPLFLSPSTHKISIYTCAKYSDFLCIWLRKCDFFTEKLGIKFIPDPDWPDPKWFIPDPNTDPAKSSGSDRIRIHNTGSIEWRNNQSPSWSLSMGSQCSLSVLGCAVQQISL